MTPTIPEDAVEAARGRKFALGDRVTKIKGSSWTGRVVGFYGTRLTPIGYAVESENEPGSVQIYPELALVGAMSAQDLIDALSALSPSDPEDKGEDENAPDMLARLRDDAALWAAEFRKTAIKIGYSDMDEGWLIGWFANAIENTEVVRREQWSRTDPAPSEGLEVVAWAQREVLAELAKHRDATGAIASGLLTSPFGMPVALVRAEEANARIADLEAEVERVKGESHAKDFALRNGKSFAEDAVHAIRQLLRDQGVPAASFIDDHVANAIVQRNQYRDRADALEKALLELVQRPTDIVARDAARKALTSGGQDE